MHFRGIAQLLTTIGKACLMSYFNRFLTLFKLFVNYIFVYL